MHTDISNKLFIINPLLRYDEFDDASSCSYLIEIPEEDGKTNKLIAPEWLLNSIRLFDKANTVNEAAEQYQNINNTSKPGKETFLSLINDYLIPNKILVETNENNLLAKRTKSRSSYLNIKLPIIRPSIIRPISAFFSALHNKTWFVLLMVISLSIITSFLISNNSYSELTTVTTTDTFYLVLILAAGLFFHEIGHASAAYKYGCRNIEIGVGWYMIFIIFYADLTESWKLKKKQRVVIDLGGMYFQTLFIATLCVVNNFQPDITFQVAIFALIISLLLNLNPFFRMDGFWLASDLLGIANLKKVSNDITRNFFLKIFGIKSRQRTTLNYPKRTMTYLNLYITISNIVLLLICYIFVNILLQSVTLDIPSLLNILLGKGYYQLDTTEKIFTVINISWLILLSLFIVYFLLKKTWKIFSFLLKAYSVKKVKKIQ